MNRVYVISHCYNQSFTFQTYFYTREKDVIQEVTKLNEEIKKRNIKKPQPDVKEWYSYFPLHRIGSD